MRMSRLFAATLRQPPAEAPSATEALLARAGYLRPLPGGGPALLPPGSLTLQRLQRALVAAAPESQPLLLPGEEAPGEAAWLGQGTLEALVHLLRGQVQSYRQLPRSLRLLQPVRRGQAGPGLRRAESTLRLTFLHVSAAEALQAGLDDLEQRLSGRLQGLGLEAAAAEALPGAGLRAVARLWVAEGEEGETRLLGCPACSYRAEASAARFRRQQPPDEEPIPLEKVATPGADTIAALAAYLGVPESRTAKALFRVAGLPDGRERLVFAVIRGDLEVSEGKLAHAVGACSLRPATEAEIRAAGAEPGYASPLGVREALVIVDESIPASPNLVAGANEPGYHLKNVNYGRDFQAEVVADLAQAAAGAPCPECGAPLEPRQTTAFARGVRLPPEATEPPLLVQGPDGRPQPMSAGWLEIDLPRLLAALAERHHDASGLAWPAALAPWPVHLIALRGGEEAAEGLYQALSAQGLEPLFDDRDESPGVKFNDADLMGLPLRVVVGRRSLEAGGAEVRRRGEAEAQVLPLEQVPAWAREALAPGNGPGP